MIASRWVAVLLLVAACAIDQRAAAADSGSIESVKLVNGARERLQRGAETGDSRQFAEAVSMLERAVHADPANLDTRLMLGWAYLEKVQEPAKAYDGLRALDVLRPGHLETEKLLAIASSYTGRFRQAIAVYRRVLARDPADSWMSVMLAKTLFWSNRIPEAQAALDAVLARDPANLAARITGAEIIAAQGHLESAESLLQDLDEEHPDDALVLATLGDVRRWSWELRSARQTYERALAVDRGHAQAQHGLDELHAMRGIQVRPQHYHFTDSYRLTQAASSVAIRMPLWPRASATVSVVDWNVTQYEASLRRQDRSIELHQQVDPTLQLRMRLATFTSEHGGSTSGFGASLGWSPAVQTTVYGSFARHEPVMETLAAARTGLTQTTYGGGIDAVVRRNLSVQAGFAHSWYSDGNRRIVHSSQLSLRLRQRPEIFARFQFEETRFRDPAAVYFAPERFRVARPRLDISYPMVRGLSLAAKLEAPFVVSERRTGHGIAIGPILRWRQRVEIQGWYFDHRVPASNTWSGRGVQLQSMVLF